jgi:hypothetical protein
MLTVVVSGSRDYDDYRQFKSGMDRILVEWQLALAKSEIVLYNGGAKGTDKMVQQYGKERDIDVKTIPAKWDDFSEPCVEKTLGNGYEYNALAGHRRNREMLELAQHEENRIFIAFLLNNSDGTKNAIDIAKELKIKSYIYRITK